MSHELSRFLARTLLEVGVLRLRECSASRSTHSAQDDKVVYCSRDVIRESLLAAHRSLLIAHGSWLTAHSSLLTALFIITAHA